MKAFNLSALFGSALAAAALVTVPLSPEAAAVPAAQVGGIFCECTPKFTPRVPPRPDCVEMRNATYSTLKAGSCLIEPICSLSKDCEIGGTIYATGSCNVWRLYLNGEFIGGSTANGMIVDCYTILDCGTTVTYTLTADGQPAMGMTMDCKNCAAAGM